MPTRLRFGWVAVMAAMSACTQLNTRGVGGTSDGGATKSSCSACLSTTDCTGGEQCAQLSADSFCAGSCTKDSDCASGQTCFTTSSFSGAQLSVCVNTSGACSAGAEGGGSDGGSMSGTCNGLAGPDVSGTCCVCGTGHTCSANNCYGGWFCDPAACRCSAAPASCGATDGGSGNHVGPITGTVDPHSGGTVSNLYFAVVGDTRPANEDDTANYPKAIITKIYQDIAALSPQPSFVIGTGDYQFTNPARSEQTAQLGYYAAARALYSGVYWPAMGNHECTGYTASNCGPGTSTGDTSNYTVFKQDFLTPIGETNPNYVRRVDATDGSWTAKFIILAPNYWNGSAQQSWFQTQLATSTTYTFVIHHENSTAGNPASLSTIESMVAAASGRVTLSIVGHSHTWRYQTGSPGEVIVGNGGAPVSGSSGYGYTLFSRRPSDGAILFANYDYMSNAPKASYAVLANGTATH